MVTFDKNMPLVNIVITMETRPQKSSSSLWKGGIYGAV